MIDKYPEYVFLKTETQQQKSKQPNLKMGKGHE